MKQLMAKLIAVSLAMTLMTSGLIGCGESELGKETHKDAPLRYSVKSSKTKFNIDDVILDFYYGSYRSNSFYICPESSDEVEIVGWALYFCDGPYYENTLYYHFDPNYKDFLYDDYRNIDGHYFVKEISIEEFESYNYSVSLTAWHII
ncbi:MAG: hypothetical protein FWE97_01825 [Dehalococcoidia bacterium]|nr:hypothetical protein [Dehalococcoidia bacterium]